MPTDLINEFTICVMKLQNSTSDDILRNRALAGIVEIEENIRDQNKRFNYRQ